MLKVKLCMGSSCFARGNGELLSFLENYIKTHSLDVQIELSGCHCQNLCTEGPNIFIGDEKYSALSGEQVVKLIEKKSFKG